MSGPTQRALKRMHEAADKADREAEELRRQGQQVTVELAERCEGQAVGLRAAARMLEEELARG